MHRIPQIRYQCGGIKPLYIILFLLSPRQLGFTDKHSANREVQVGGKSKLVYSMDIVDNAMKQKPYDSNMEPLQVLFSLGSQVGAMVKDSSVVLHIGMGKASACRMMLEVVCKMNMDIQAVKGLDGILKALLRIKCTYDPADTEEQQLNRACAGTCIYTQRSRPDPKS